MRLTLRPEKSEYNKLSLLDNNINPTEWYRFVTNYNKIPINDEAINISYKDTLLTFKYCDHTKFDIVKNAYKYPKGGLSQLISNNQVINCNYRRITNKISKLSFKIDSGCPNFEISINLAKYNIEDHYGHCITDIMADLKFIDRNDIIFEIVFEFILNIIQHNYRNHSNKINFEGENLEDIVNKLKEILGGTYNGS